MKLATPKAPVNGGNIIPIHTRSDVQMPDHLASLYGGKKYREVEGLTLVATVVTTAVLQQIETIADRFAIPEFSVAGMFLAFGFSVLESESMAGALGSTCSRVLWRSLQETDSRFNVFTEAAPECHVSASLCQMARTLNQDFAAWTGRVLGIGAEAFGKPAARGLMIDGFGHERMLSLAFHQRIRWDNDLDRQPMTPALLVPDFANGGMVAMKKKGGRTK